MHHREKYEWITQGNRRQDLLIEFKQPMTAKQLQTASRYSLDCVSYVLNELEKQGLVECLNKQSTRSRVFGVTALGQKLQRQLCRDRGLSPSTFEKPDIDWDLYGWVCFTHRGAVLKALRQPMQPATIKRVASRDDPELKISANNVRDIIKLFLEKGIVEREYQRKKSHPLYCLTEVGTTLRDLLIALDHHVMKGGGQQNNE